MLVKHNKKNNKRDESRRIREEDEEKDLEKFNKRQISSEENNNNINCLHLRNVQYVPKKLRLSFEEVNSYGVKFI